MPMPPPDGEPLLRVRGLTTWLGNPERPVRAVDGIDLDIRAGETFALLGESGCGKSMTALSIMRLLPPNGRIIGGDVLLEGQALLDLSETAMRRERGGRAAMIFQEPMTSLNPVMTVGAQIAEAVRLHDPSARPALERRVVELLEAVGIPDPQRRRREYPHQLSGGMKQRVMIAMALAGRPRLLIADEPTTALDVTIQAQVLALLKQLQRETGMAVLLITHDLGVVAEVADRLAVMYAGEIVETGAAHEFFVAPRHPYSRKLFRALPGADKRSERLEVIPGMVPSLDATFTGCRFVARCAEARPLCRAQAPSWHPGPSDSGCRCHFPATGEMAAVRDVSAPARPVADGRSLVAVRDLRVHFPIHKGLFRRTVGAVKAVDGVDLEIGAGRTLALVGESGCGKTTVGKALLRLIEPTAGEVLFEGADLATLSREALRRKRREFQIIFQDPASSMNPRMLVGDIVAEGLVAQGIGDGREERRARVVRLLEQVGMPADAVDRYPHEFSGGQRQRICIARALALEPRLIVCDEPTSALDVSVQAQVLNLLRALQAEFGLSYLFITHDISVVAYVADEIAVMYLGRIVERGTVAEVLERPAHPYTRALLAAVPKPDPAQRREHVPLKGDLPSPAAPPAGCHFHPRCPEATAVCREGYPGFRQLSETHRVACVLHNGRA
jgi:peptide/nickel transport system ATP-binding protein